MSRPFRGASQGDRADFWGKASRTGTHGWRVGELCLGILMIKTAPTRGSSRCEGAADSRRPLGEGQCFIRGSHQGEEQTHFDYKV